MGVVHLLDPPDPGLSDGDADFLLQLTPQGLLHSFAFLQLAARKLPVAGIDLAVWPGRQQEGAIGTEQYADGHIDRLAVCPTLPGPVTIGHQNRTHP